VVEISALTDDGKEAILALLRPGEVFGEEAVIERRREATWPRREMAFKVTKLVGFRLKTLRTKVEGLLFKGAPARLAQTLLDIARDHGVKDAEGILLALKLSHQDIANLIGVTRESVNLALADFEVRGLVQSEGRVERGSRPDAPEALT
jgi:CRP/FNR family cyclic AMP-dependent transcriptional regulator